ncbi:MAG: selenocysteine-specific translation elongation factor [Fusobacteriaceae bacterium]
MKNLIIGTAGHIDHGKTTLIKNLTGFETDTLPEEAKRGMTINLGFAYYSLPNGRKVGVIDVPGHEKFIKNMVAGATGIDFILLVIACDDGIMPQTVEHANICRILGVDRGLIVLTKRDLASDEKVHQIKDDIKLVFKNSFIENLPVVEVSSKDPLSYLGMKNILNSELEKIGFKDENKKSFRMSVDRSFSVKGFGTVVTGTSISGVVNTGDTLFHYPSKKEIKVKGIQNHGISVDSLDAGNRCALNLHGIDKDEIKRGDIVSHDGTLHISDRIDAHFTLLNKDKKIKNNSRIRVHIGTTEVIGRMKLLDLDEITDSNPAFVQIELEEPIVAVAGDIGVIRNYSPLDTLGGITILNPLGTKTKKRNFEYLSKLHSLAYGDESEKIVSYLNSKKKASVSLADISRDLGIVIEPAVLNSLIEKQSIFLLDGISKKYISIATLNFWEEDVKNFLKNYHEWNTLKKGISKSEIKNRYFNNLHAKDFNAILLLMQDREILNFSEDIVYLKDFKPKLNKMQKIIKDDILTIYKKLGFAPDYLDKVISLNSNIIKNEKEFLEVHNFLLDSNLLVSLGQNIYIMRGFFLEAEKILREFFLSHEKITLKEYRDLLNVSRSEALIFLDKFDSQGITKRVEDYRILKK